MPVSREVVSERQGAHVVEMQRRRLILAICELLAQMGLEDVSVGKICKRAGVSRRTFYELFDERDDCVLAALDSAVERIGVQASAAYASERSWRAGVRAGLTVILGCLDAEPGVARLCVVESVKAGPQVAERRARALAALAGTVEEGRVHARRGQGPPPLTGQGVVGGALSVIHERLLAGAGARTGATSIAAAAYPAGDEDNPSGGSLSGLVGPLMAMIVHPYLGAAAARGELVSQPAVPPREDGLSAGVRDPFSGLSIRLTYRTARVLATIADEPGASNRHIADSAGIADEGQTSRLLRRLQHSGLIENGGAGRAKGEANAWTLTERGVALQAAIGDGGRDRVVRAG